MTLLSLSINENNGIRLFKKVLFCSDHTNILDIQDLNFGKISREVTV